MRGWQDGTNVGEFPSHLLHLGYNMEKVGNSIGTHGTGKGGTGA